MYLLRPHRGSLSDSMDDLKTFNTKEDMMHYIAEDLKQWIHGGTFTITVERYTDSHDERIDWDTTDVVSWIYDGQRYVWGFCTEKEVNEDSDYDLMRRVIFSSLVDAKNRNYDDFATAKYITDILKEYHFKIVVF